MPKSLTRSGAMDFVTSRPTAPAEPLRWDQVTHLPPPAPSVTPARSGWTTPSRTLMVFRLRRDPFLFPVGTHISRRQAPPRLTAHSCQVPPRLTAHSQLT